MNKHLNDYKTAIGVLERLESNAEDEQAKAWLYAARNAVEKAEEKEVENVIDEIAAIYEALKSSMGNTLVQIGKAMGGHDG